MALIPSTLTPYAFRGLATTFYKLYFRYLLCCCRSFYCLRGNWRFNVLNAVVRGVNGWKPGVGGIFLSSHNFSLCETGESSSSIAFAAFLARYFSFASFVGNIDHMERRILKKKIALHSCQQGFLIGGSKGTYSMRMLAANEPFAIRQLCLLPETSAYLQLFVMYQATLLECSGSE